ncbi:hypothetical protein [Desulfoluna spongiiphila]|uniref:Carboxypeptidase regulatory-like domain-containing protein n=1 Tax=Desulfoluna spongiiphila TaxID=419481 RepID=A0A1G5HQ46_9BACT|nr:hypothetical protein [Desulfoluna spongiiphila]SCY65834.1 hypothetical protein SAMN05216233_11553 [Desulfoluna spongiiphila]
MKIHGQTNWMKRLLIVLAALTLVACGDSDNDNPISTTPTSKTITGVAATGAAMANAAVILVDSQGRRLAGTTDASGKYRITGNNLTPPFAVTVTDGDGNRHYAVSMDVGCINVTPLTGAITSAVLGGADPSTIMEKLSTVTAAKITTAQNELKAAMAPLLEAFGAVDMDFICDEFQANSRGIDGLLDVIRVEIDGASGTLTLKTTTDQVLMEARLDESGATVTTPLTQGDLSNIPQLDNKVYGDGDYHVVDFNASTTDEITEMNWGSARFTADGFVTLTFTHSNKGIPGQEIHDYTLADDGILRIDGDSGVEGAFNTDKSLMVLSDIHPGDGDTGVVFFIEKGTATPAIDGDYALLYFTRNNTGEYETDSWPTDLHFTWDANNKEAAYVDEGTPSVLSYSPDGSLSGPNGLTVFPACEGAILVAPHASPDDPGVTLLVRKPTAPYPDFSDTNVNAMADFITPGFVINTESDGFTGHRNNMRLEKQTDTTGALTLESIVTEATIQCENGVFQKMNGATPVEGSFGVYPHEGIFLWVDEKEGDGDHSFGFHVGFRTNP